MKIGIQTWGTEGDIRPFIALAGGLSAAGHEVTLAVTEITNQRFTAYSERLGFTLRHVGHIDMDENRFKELARDVFFTRNPVKKGDILITHFFDPVIEDMAAAAQTLCAENDIVIGHFFLYPLKIAALKQQRPFVMVFTTPLIPSRHNPPLGIPDLGAWINPIWWKCFDTALNITWKPTIDELYRREGVDPERSVLHDIWHSSHLNLVSISPALFPPPPDWEQRFHLCGFLNVPEKAEPWQMPPDLRQFIEDGDPPVYMTFGSMLAGEEDPGQVLGILSDAARLAQCRAIIQADWAGLSDHPQADHVHRISQAPHQYIFPCCAAVVHHGGAGTTQAATLAGCPSIVVEHASDQPLWGSVLQRMGIAPKMLHRRSLTAHKLARAIQAVMKTPAMKDKAGRIGAMMQNEDGLATAVALIAQHGKIDKFQ